MKRVLIGSLAGLVATLPMTMIMEMLHRQLPPTERYPLPPREITEKLAEEADVKDELSEPEQTGLTLVSHFAYGTAAGAAYVLTADRLPLSPILRGPAFATALWAASYLGWLPALGILRPATEHPPRRNALMIAAHLVWGATAAAITNQLIGSRDKC
jgi:uncharacterized membrane protein YagU involved in acid resistance